jgi:hypothetical protein
LYNVDIELLIFSIIDPQNVFKAETSISHYFNKDKLTNYFIKEVEQTELIIINKNSINSVKEQIKKFNILIEHYRLI